MNISKKLVFVIAFCTIFSGCSRVFSNVKDTVANSNINKPTEATDKSKDYEKAEVTGTIDSAEISESSGITASRCNPDVFWTHNDSGDEALIYAIEKTGKKLGTFKVANAKNIDWEDIATRKDESGKCFLYIGDIGNNRRTRSEMAVYKVAEPKISENDKSSSKKSPIDTESAEAIKFTYPNGNFDSESLLVNPKNGDIYVLSKTLVGTSEVFKIGKNGVAEKVADIRMPVTPEGFLTGAEISPDGTRIIICDYFNAYEITLPKTAKNFDEIWKEKPLVIELGERKQGEAICYSADGKSIVATSEKKNSPLIKVERK
jgi:DNA-binding beta-propeller fold protein YncE